MCAPRVSSASLARTTGPVPTRPPTFLPSPQANALLDSSASLETPRLLTVSLVPSRRPISKTIASSAPLFSIVLVDRSPSSLATRDISARLKPQSPSLWMRLVVSALLFMSALLTLEFPSNVKTDSGTL